MYRRIALLVLLLGSSTSWAANFSDYPASRIYSGRPAPVTIASPGDNNQFKRHLAKVASEGPNFAGAYTIVHWACGEACEVISILSAETGAIKKVLSTCGAHAFRLYSNLLILNPADAGRTYPEHCKPEYLVWTGEELRPVAAAQPGY